MALTQLRAPFLCTLHVGTRKNKKPGCGMIFHRCVLQTLLMVLTGSLKHTHEIVFFCALLCFHKDILTLFFGFMFFYFLVLSVKGT